MSQIKDKAEKITEKISEQVPNIVDQILDKLIGKNASVTYSFENLSITMPNAQGPLGKRIGSGKLIINGNVIISAELTYDKYGTINKSTNFGNDNTNATI